MDTITQHNGHYSRSYSVHGINASISRFPHSIQPKCTPLPRNPCISRLFSHPPKVYIVSFPSCQVSLELRNWYLRLNWRVLRINRAGVSCGDICCSWHQPFSVIILHSAQVSLLHCIPCRFRHRRQCPAKCPFRAVSSSAYASSRSLHGCPTCSGWSWKNWVRHQCGSLIVNLFVPG